ncbi:unnamed protein product [Tenebrio molitor]|nr:unnamed protein product [Tenebrio molitor]
MKFFMFGSNSKYIMNESGQVPTGKFCVLDPHPPVRLTRHRWYESHSGGSCRSWFSCS